MRHTPETLRVRLEDMSDRSYPIQIATGIFQKLPVLLQRLRGKGTLFIITDSNVRRLYGRKLVSLCAMEELPAVLLDFPAGEGSKNFRVVESLHSGLLYAGIRRDAVIVALGGGVVGDVAGFVAATILRGVRYVQVPTTLLAQVDSSVGGKTGVNHRLGKHLIGAFYQPKLVLIDVRLLLTLSPRDYYAGFAEVIKYGVINDQRFFLELVENVKELKNYLPQPFNRS